MATANVQIKKILVGRGNTTVASNYSGVRGEITMDTDLKALRIHDGVQVGGYVMAGQDWVEQYVANAALGGIDTNVFATTSNLNALGANLGAFETYANLTFGAGTYSNTNVAAYLIANPQGSTYSNANVASYLSHYPGQLVFTSSVANISGVDIIKSNEYQFANGVSILTGIGGTYSNANVQTYIGANLGAFQTYANTTFSTVANAASQQTAINNINANIGAFQIYSNANVGTISTTLTNLHANVGAYESYANLTFSTVANAGTQQTDINALRANVTAANSAITTANTGMKSYVDAVTTAWTANAGTQATDINGLRANITAANSAITTANTGMKSYVDAITTAVTANAATQGAAINSLQTQTYNNTNVAAYLAGNVTVGNLTVANNAVILGNLRVLGTQTTVNTATLNVTDLYITVANAAVQASDANGAGIRVAGALANIAYSSVTDSFEFNKPITANIRQTGNISFVDGTFMTTSWVANAGTQQTAIDNFNANLGAYQSYANSAISNLTVANLDSNGFQVTLNSTGVLTLPSGGEIANIAYLGSNLSTGISDVNGVAIGTGFDNDIRIIPSSNTEFRVNGNLWLFGQNGNLTLPNNMSFISSPAMSTTGIVFGDGSFQRTAYTEAPVSQLVNGVHTVGLDPTGNLTVPGDILSAVDNLHDLGSATNRFRHLYVGPGTVYIGNASIKSTATGNLILPGLTRAVASSAYAEEIDDRGDQSHSFGTTPTIIDNAQYSDLSGRVTGLSFTPAEYSVDQLDGEGFIDGITIDSRGSGYSDQVAELAQQNMWATETADPVNNFVGSDWIQIPFQVRSRAGETEYEFNTGGGSSDRLTNAEHSLVLDSDGKVSFPGNLAIANGVISNLNNTNGDSSEGSQIEVAPGRTVINTQVTNSLGGDGPFLQALSQIEVTASNVTIGTGVINSMGDDSSSLTVSSLFQTTASNVVIGYATDNLLEGSAVTTVNLVEVNSGNVLIGQRVTNSLLGEVTLDAFTGWTFGTDGILQIPGAITLDANSQSTQISISPNGEGAAFLQIPNTDTADTDNTRLANTIGNVTIETGAGQWIFGNTGNLTLPPDSGINFANGVNILSTVTGGGGSLGGFGAYYNALYTNNNDDMYLAPLWDSGPGAAYLKLPGDTNAGGNAVVLSNQLENGAGVSIVSSNPRNSNTEYTWNFAANGTLTIPGGIEFTSSTATIANVDTITVLDHIRSPAYQFANGVSILNGLATIVGNVGGDPANGTLWYNTEDGRTYVRAGGYWVDANPTIVAPPSFYTGNLEIAGSSIISDTKSWTFGTDGNLSLPAGTAYYSTFFDVNYAVLTAEGYGTIAVISNNGLTIEATSVMPNNIEPTALFNTPILEGEKKMFSIRVDRVANNNNGWNGIGIGTHGMNIEQYLGSDNTYSVGFYEQGDYYGNQRSLANPAGYTTGDIIDVAVDNDGFNIWMRVNGGSWNNNASANPATNAYGFETGEYGTVYPGVTPTNQGSGDPGNKFTLLTTPIYGVPAGFEFYGAESYNSTYIKFGDNDLTVDATGNLLVNGNLVTGSGGSGGTGNILVNGAYEFALEANGVLTLGSATISNNGEYRLWATDTDITVYRNGRDGYSVTDGNIKTYTNNGLRTVTNSQGFELKTGNVIIPNDKGVVFANGTNILSSIPSIGNITFSDTEISGTGSNVTLTADTTDWTFYANGTTTFPANISIDYGGGNNVQYPRIIATSGKSISVQGQGSTGSAALAWSVDPESAGQYAAVGVTKEGGDNLAKVVLQAQSNSGDAATVKLWKFDETGNLRLPLGGTITEANVGLADALILTPANISYPGQQLRIYSTGTVVEGNHLHLTTGNLYATELYLGDDNYFVKLDNTGNVGIRATTQSLSSTALWTFDTTGNLIFPGGMTIGSFENSSIIIQANAAITLGTYDTLGQTFIGWSEFTDEPGNIAGASFNVTQPGAVTIATGYAGTNAWTFHANGSTTSPATGTATVANLTAFGNVAANYFSAIQYNFANGVPILSTINGLTSISSSVTTGLYSDASGDFQYGTLSYSYAVNGNNGQFSIEYSEPLVYGNVDISVGNVTATGTATVANLIISGSAPGTLSGSAGDTAGMVRVDSNYIYYCTSAFASNVYTVGWDGAVGNTLFLAQGSYPTPQVGWTVTHSVTTVTIDSVTDDGYGHWQIIWTGTPYGSPNGGTATLTNPTPLPAIWTRTLSLTSLKTVVAASTSFADFQTRIAAL